MIVDGHVIWPVGRSPSRYHATSRKAVKRAAQRLGGLPSLKHIGVAELGDLCHVERKRQWRMR